jgi:predicted alpha/beta-hydrolase family hydrolase
VDHPDVTPFLEPSVRGFLHRPAQDPNAALVLTHGAGGNCRTPLLVAVATAFCSAGFLVLRCDLPFRQRRPFGPPSPNTAAADRQGLRDAAERMRGFTSGPICLAGHSYGARQASILAAESPECAAALLLLSYPLHPPRKPGQLRTAHFRNLQTPALFVHGTSDPFGSLEEMQRAIQLIPAPTRLVPIERAGHDLARGKFDLERLVVDEFLNLAISSNV